MKKTTAVVLVAVMVLAFSTGVFAFQNEPNGFRGLVWGDAPGEDLEIVIPEENKMIVYTKKEENLFLGNVPLDTVMYGFFDRRFCNATVIFKGTNAFNEVKKLIEQKFGKANNETFMQLAWVGTVTTIILQEKIEEGFFTIFSPTIFQEAINFENLAEGKAAEGDW